MAKKRSAGVLIVGIILIILALSGMPGLLNFKEYSASCFRFETGLMSYIQFVYGIITTIGSLIAGIFILTLKNWARKLAIALSVAALLIAAWGSYAHPFNKKDMEEITILVKEEMDASVQKGAEKLKPEYQEEYIQKQKMIIDMTMKSMPIFYYAFLIMVFLWNTFIIYFFTRPKVKQQFI